MEPYETLLYPLMGEKATMLREKENTLTFIVDKRASKKDVRIAAEKMFNVKVVDVRVMHTTDGHKKAHIKLDKKHKADEIASHMGVL
ncbi:MAG: 50S ribosomal protein L23 [Candidatus Altiarchaeota archaeon]